VQKKLLYTYGSLFANWILMPFSGNREQIAPRYCQLWFNATAFLSVGLLHFLMPAFAPLSPKPMLKTPTCSKCVGLWCSETGPYSHGEIAFVFKF